MGWNFTASRFLMATVMYTALFIFSVTAEEATVSTQAQTDEESFRYKSPVPAGNAYLAEHFDIPDAFKDQWVQSEAKKDGADSDIAKYDGEFAIETPDEENRLKGDYGMALRTKARHHAISSALNRPFVFENRPLIVQYEVMFQNGMECGGAYLKLLSQPQSLGPQVQQKITVPEMMRAFNDKTIYSIMFGPDKCGTEQKLHFIFQHKNPKTGVFQEKHWKQAKNAGGAMGGKFNEVFVDKKSHQYTLIVSPDNTFDILIDGRSEAKGSLLDDFDPPVNPPKEIEDADDSKPDDWDEREKIPDPEATKPEDWDEAEPQEIADPNAEKPVGWFDDEPSLIPDPEAVRPRDWDEDMDGMWEAPLVDNPRCKDAGCGEWKAPMIANPKYKGKWRAPMIDNPAYRGKWKPRKIANPEYFEDLQPFFHLQPVVAVGFELWSMSDGILFDNLLVTDDRAVSTQWGEDGFFTKRRVLDGKAGGGVSAFFTNAFVTFVDYSTQYPWLWAIYVLALGIPTAFIIGYCCMSPSKSSSDEDDMDEVARRKKTDEPSGSGTRREDMEELVEEDDEDVEEIEEVDSSELHRGSGDESQVRQRGVPQPPKVPATKVSNAKSTPPTPPPTTDDLSDEQASLGTNEDASLEEDEVESSPRATSKSGGSKKSPKVPTRQRRKARKE